MAGAWHDGCSEATTAMDAISFLRRDHDRIRKLLRDRLRAAPARKGGIGARILAEIETHTRLEEEILYPAVRARSNREGRRRLVEFVEEHRAIRDLVEEGKRVRAAGREPEPCFLLLRHRFEHHVGKEEAMFPDIVARLGDEVGKLGERLRARRHELADARPPIAAKPSSVARRRLRLIGGTPAGGGMPRTSRARKRRGTSFRAERGRRAAHPWCNEVATRAGSTGRGEAKGPPS
jgi:hypothetical protein